MIYFIRYGTRRIVKIGHSSEHPRVRLSSLQTGTPERLFLIGMTEGGREEEADWHRRFDHLRLRGEWFRWTPELRDAVKPHLHDRFGRKARALAAAAFGEARCRKRVNRERAESAGRA